MILDKYNEVKLASTLLFGPILFATWFEFQRADGLPIIMTIATSKASSFLYSHHPHNDDP